MSEPSHLWEPEDEVVPDRITVTYERGTQGKIDWVTGNLVEQGDFGVLLHDENNGDAKVLINNAYVIRIDVHDPQ